MDKPVYQLVDTHAHLDEIEDLERTISEAKLANLTAIIAVGSDLQSNRKVLSLTQAYKGFVYPALGLHPWNLKDADIALNLEFIESHLEEAVAIGEIGLDYDKRVRARTEKDLQKQVLRQLLRIAKNHRKPVTIHSRYAWRDSLNLAGEVGVEKVVFHWYTGTSSVLREIINRGYLISATPAVEYHQEHRRAIKEVPLEGLLLETDSPVIYQRGTEFEYSSRPAHVLRVLKAAASLKGVAENQIAQASTDNALKFFDLRRT